MAGVDAGPGVPQEAMTVAAKVDRFESARTLLRGPLKFGDQAALDAVKLLESVEALAEQLKRCNHDKNFTDESKVKQCHECDGKGRAECYVCGHSASCKACKGEGEIIQLCDCVEQFAGTDFLDEAFRLARILMPDNLRWL